LTRGIALTTVYALTCYTVMITTNIRCCCSSQVLQSWLYSQSLHWLNVQERT